MLRALKEGISRLGELNVAGRTRLLILGVTSPAQVDNRHARFLWGRVSRVVAPMAKARKAILPRWRQPGDTSVDGTPCGA